MRIYFGVCGIGLGHAGRCIPIARKLIQEGAEVLISTYRDALEYIEKANLKLVKAPSVGFVVKPDGTVDFRQTVANPGPILASITLAKQVESEIKFMRSFKPDVVVSDSRVSPMLAAKFLNIPDICILNQFQIIIPRRSRLIRLAKLVDTGALAIIGKIWTSGAAHLMIPDFPPPYVLSAGNLRIPRAYQKRVKLIGPILPVSPEELPSKNELKKALGIDENSKLIFVPISGPIKERAHITRTLKHILPDLPEEYKIVMSLGYPNRDLEPIRRGNATIYGWLPNRYEHMKACDLVLSRAGHGTLVQSVCYGKPMVLIPTPSHTEQLNNAYRVKEMGIAEVLQQKDVDRDTVLEAVRKVLLDVEYSRKISEIQASVSGNDGLKVAVETIKRVAET